MTNGFSINTIYLVSVAAENDVGVGPYSTELEILTDNVPTRMNTPVEDPSTNATQIVVTWASITDEADTGRDPVIYYSLEWDRGYDSWRELTRENVSVNTYMVNTEDDDV